jgi:hypothetical protein
VTLADRLAEVLERLGRLAAAVERLVPPEASVQPLDWDGHVAFRWQRGRPRGRLLPVAEPHRIRLEDLRGVDRQKAELERNTRQFLAGRPANNVLLWGSRGTGKSSLVKALLETYAGAGLRLVEVEREDLADLAEITGLLGGRPERFVLFCDDLSFEPGDASFKALKAVLDGSLAAVPANVLVYATSNRRHLMPEYLRENLEARLVEGEIHPGETTEEKVSLSERFGLWLSFYPFDQDRYLEIALGWVERLGGAIPDPDGLREEALRWALARGSRSGRAAYQFARDWVGRQGTPD